MPGAVCAGKSSWDPILAGGGTQRKSVDLQLELLSNLKVRLGARRTSYRHPRYHKVSLLRCSPVEPVGLGDSAQGLVAFESHVDQEFETEFLQCHYLKDGVLLPLPWEFPPQEVPLVSLLPPLSASHHGEGVLALPPSGRRQVLA